MKLKGYTRVFPFIARLQLVGLIFCAGKTSAQSAIQQLDDRVIISLAENRTPEQTNVMLFLTKHTNAAI
jgi:hypothetical protein